MRASCRTVKGPPAAAWPCGPYCSSWPALAEVASSPLTAGSPHRGRGPSALAGHDHLGVRHVPGRCVRPRLAGAVPVRLAHERLAVNGEPEERDDAARNADEHQHGLHDGHRLTPFAWRSLMPDGSLASSLTHLR